MGSLDEQLDTAIRNGYVRAVAQLLEQGANIEGTGEQPFSPIYNTVISFCDEDSQLKIAKLLLEHGADPNRKVATNTNLVMAVRRGRLELVKLLLAYRASMLSKDNDSIDRSLVEFAEAMSQPQIASILKSALG